MLLYHFRVDRGLDSYIITINLADDVRWKIGNSLILSDCFQFSLVSANCFQVTRSYSDRPRKTALVWICNSLDQDLVIIQIGLHFNNNMLFCLFLFQFWPRSLELYSCQALDLPENDKATFSTHIKSIVVTLNRFLGSEDAGFWNKVK
jgi:hypothetical protein